MISLAEHAAFGVGFGFGHISPFLQRFRPVKRLFTMLLTAFVKFLHRLFFIFSYFHIFIYPGSLRHRFFAAVLMFAFDFMCVPSVNTASGDGYPARSISLNIRQNIFSVVFFGISVFEAMAHG